MSFKSEFDILEERLPLSKNHKDTSWIYSRMASILKNEYKDSFEYQKLDYKFKLLSYNDLGIDKTQISSVEHSCPYSPKFHNKILSVKDELNNQSFPKRECTKIIDKHEDSDQEEITYELCSCLYLAYFDEH